MDMESRAKQKKHGLGRFLSSFKYSIDGLVYTYKYEQSMTIHLTVTALVIIAGLFFRITYFEWLICFLMISIILATELLNTSIEAVVDLACPKIDPLAKIAKDTGSAAVFIYSLVAFVAGLMIFVPYIIKFINSLL